MRTAAPLALALLLSGCAIADRSDRFGADFELSLGGILAYAIDIKLKASVGFSKTCPEEVIPNGPMEGNATRPGRGDRGFL